jgi:2-hydroxychromene-2-carboxylate isomerase
MRKIAFWFEFGSTYTYLTVARLRRAADAAGVQVEWKPFLLMPLMVEQGMNLGPFLPYPRKIEYMWRDLQRRAAEHGLPYRRPEQYPPEETLTSARLALLGAQEGWCAQFVESAFHLHWAQGRPIGTADNIETSLRAAGQSPEETVARARSVAIKEGLKQQTEDARRAGLFGSPSFLVGDELFWGDDRLEQAIAWARTH